MSNLGWYQTMTTTAKRVGGPGHLIQLPVCTEMLIGGSIVALFATGFIGIF